MPWRVLSLSVLTIAVLFSSRADEKDSTPKTLLELAKMSEDGKDITQSARSVKQKYKELTDVMESFKSRSRKGIGFGPKSPDDGIESKILALGKQPLTATTLKKERSELIRMGHLTIAISEVARHYSVKPKKVKDAKGWEKRCGDLKSASSELVQALKDNNAKSVQRAATSIQKACNNCHVEFRD